MKTYFIKDSDTEKTAEEYLSKQGFNSKKRAFDYISSTGQKYTDMFQKILDTDEKFSIADEASRFFDYVNERNPAGIQITKAIDNAERDGNKKAVQGIKDIVNKTGFITMLSLVGKNLNKTIETLNRYKDTIDTAIDNFKSLGVTK